MQLHSKKLLSANFVIFLLSIAISYLIIITITFSAQPVTHNQTNISTIVDQKRKNTIPNPLRNTFINKATIFATTKIDEIFSNIDNNLHIKANFTTLIGFYIFYFLGVIATSHLSIFAPILVIFLSGFVNAIFLKEEFYFVIIAIGVFTFIRFIFMDFHNIFYAIPSKQYDSKYNRFSIKYIIFLICLASVFRFIYLNNIPTGVNGDELMYAIAAKSVTVSGTDFTASWKPIDALWFKSPPGISQAELPYFYLLPIIKLFGLSPLSIRVPAAIFGILTVILIYLVSRILFGEYTARITGIITAINPWMIYTSRTGYEVNPSMFFYMFGLLLLLNPKSKFVLFSTIPFILAFYSYIGTKPILIPFILLSILTAFSVHRNKKLFISYFGVFITCLILVASYGINLINHPQASRLSDIMGSSQGSILNLLNIINKVPNIFSLQYLFRNGDTFFSLYDHGLFYIVDFFFVIIGLSTLFLKKKSYFILIVGFICIGITPQLIHLVSKNNFTPHITLLFPFFFMLIGLGIVGFIKNIPIRLRALTILVISSIYILSALNFINIYYFQYPLFAYSDVRIRIASEYIRRLGNSKPVVFITQSNLDSFNKYLFYSDSITTDSIPLIKSAIKSKTPKINNISFSSCNADIISTSSSTTYFIDPICGLPKNIYSSSISRPTDNGELFFVLNDYLCNSIDLPQYLTHLSIKTIITDQIENNATFCKNHLTKQK